MLRTINICEKNLFPEPPKLVAVGAADTVVLKDRTFSVSGMVDSSSTDCSSEYAYIQIQNVGANDIYYCFGQTCDNVSNYHGILSSYSTLPVPCTCAVHCYSPSGSTAALTVFKRVSL